MTDQNRTPCQRPGCNGTMVDGYCDVCGLAPPVAQPEPPAPPPSPTPTPKEPDRTGSSGSSGRRGRLGEGMVDMPAVPYRDPAEAILDDPKVPESKRYCSGCGERVGRGRDGQPGRTEGFCPKCGAGFSFTPKLSKGELAGGQYEVLGCLAHGGLGWIYLARDRNVADRWVVLKGLLDSGDADAMAAAVAERQFLATVEHPNIVKIYNVVQHRGAGYIVMEYVGGRSLKSLAVEARANGGGLPLPQVLAYGIEVLRAFSYLHGQGLLYCDFKPDNIIQTEDQLKLIDLGGVIKADDEDSPVYGTVGYQAPEIAEQGPSVSSDLYTVARTLAVLSFDFKGFTHTYRNRLPDRDKVPVLAAHESFDRLLRRATDPEPKRRYQDADDMAEQLTGVLREVLANGDGRPRPAASKLFGPEPKVIGPQGPASEELAEGLPMPLPDPADPAASYIASLDGSPPRHVIGALANPPVRSIEVGLRLARANIELGYANAAHNALDALDDTDWRVDWYRGLADLISYDPDAARWFGEVYDRLPGEAAPKLALAACAERQNDNETAIRYYELVWLTDHSYLGAAFGLARAHLARGEHGHAVNVLEMVPATSRHYVTAQLAAVRVQVQDRAGLTQGDLVTAAARLDALDLDSETATRHAALVLEAAVASLAKTTPSSTPPQLLGTDFTERGLRLALERTYRSLARLAPTRAERIALVDQANAARPRTLI